MNADLHCHSTHSDGLLAPRELVARAASRGVQLLALTDHDALSGLAEAGEEAREAGMGFVPGVEISARWSGDGPSPENRPEDSMGIHIVGLGVDADNAVLGAGLARLRAARVARARRMAESLERAGIPGALEGALVYAGNPELISRSHFARFLAAHGYARNVKAVFDYYLVEGKPGYVPQAWAALGDAVGWIRAAGGMAVLAHPGRYRLPRADMRRLVADFRDAGGAGVEVLSGSHSPEQWREFAALAKEFGLAASRGSDFHGPAESRTELGALPEMPDGSAPIWRAL
jgi:predicted metal-dependent phosphoesterase TrpH